MALFVIGELKADPELWAVAHERGLAWEYSLWLLARSLDSGGRGWVWLQELENVATSGKLFYGWKAKGRAIANVKRHVRKAQGAGMITCDGEVVRYVSRGRLARLLGVTRLAGSVGIPRRALRSLCDLRAQMLAAWHTQHGEKPISRVTMERIHGTSRTSLWRREKRARVKSKRQVSVAEYKRKDVVDSARGEHVYKANGVLWHVKPMPSIYTSPLRMCAGGRRRKVNRELKTSEGRGNVARLARLYFDERKAACKAIGAGARIAFAKLGDYHGRGLWLRVAA